MRNKKNLISPPKSLQRGSLTLYNSIINWDLAVCSHRSYIRLKASDIALQLYLACAKCYSLRELILKANIISLRDVASNTTVHL